MKKLFSKGICFYCGTMETQHTITRHLSTHLQKIENEKNHESKSAFHLDAGAAEMFLHLLIKGDSTFDELDGFLRAIWMECCGHQSSFFYKKRSLSGNAEIDMSRKFNEKLEPNMEFRYDYDFGSTTSIDLRVISKYQISSKDAVTLLSRNEPLEILCRKCGKFPATSICTVHIYESEECMFCDHCAKQHKKECADFADYARMPVVNSPRMGVCGYMGGSIDKERDGVFIMKQ